MRELALARARESRPESAYLRRGRLACQDQDLFFEMQSYNRFDEHFDMEAEQKPLASCVYPTNGKFMISYPKLTNKPGSGQAKAGRGKTEGVKPDPKQTDQRAAEAPRAMTRAEFAVEHNFRPVASEKSFDAENELSPRVIQQELLDARAELTLVRKAHYEYKKAVEPQLAEIGRLEAEAVSNTTALVRLSGDLVKLPDIEQELAAVKAKNAELTKELVDDNDLIIRLQDKVDTVAPLTQELVTAKARIAELEAGVDPEVEKLKQETLRLEAELTDSTKTRQELDAAKVESAKTQQELDAAKLEIEGLKAGVPDTGKLHATINILRQHLADIRVSVKADLVDSTIGFKDKMEKLDTQLDAWVPPA